VLRTPPAVVVIEVLHENQTVNVNVTSIFECLHHIASHITLRSNLNPIAFFFSLFKIHSAAEPLSLSAWALVVRFSGGYICP
jgi:hypothetical protein